MLDRHERMWGLGGGEGGAWGLGGREGGVWGLGGGVWQRLGGGEGGVGTCDSYG